MVTPARGPAPPAVAARSTSTKALSRGLKRSIRARCSAVNAWGSSSPALTRRATSVALSQARSSATTLILHGMPIRWTDNPEADALLEREPLALLIGLVLDQQVKMEKAFSGPYELQQRIGPLD